MRREYFVLDRAASGSLGFGPVYRRAGRIEKRRTSDKWARGSFSFNRWMKRVRS